MYLKTYLSLLSVSCIALSQMLYSQSDTSPDFKKTVLTRDFISEGVATADLNKDGKLDIVAGYYWFEAPNWNRHEMAPSKTFDPRDGYSESFLNLGMDVNLDGWDDVVIIDFPGKAGFWFENPKNASGPWTKHFIADSMGISNESPGFIDIDGDGRLDILCGDLEKKQIVWLQAPKNKGETQWKRFPLSSENVPGTEEFSHGIGYGDVDGDGFGDVVIKEGWFKGTGNLKAGDWAFQKADLGEPCSHMQVLDVNGDGKNDVVSASAHRLGVWWHEQGENNNFTTHVISTTTAQTHSSIMADLNGDGSDEYITGKRYLAHNGNDAGDADTPYLFFIEFTPDQAPYFKEHLIDSDSGAGLNIAIADINDDTRPDIVIANKNGVFLFENYLKK
ncbi:FG-GAP repeat domain-containing protein [Pareuzebyella sediminis]|uniref:FG-GAP repeat domain-containing protein n=1 Tax=Pareuzebyella sediminis TaxID=2607998 RepID=UPI0011F0249E|nr:VCBS repeat-containing protein [Pareuzebyella sediminis]